MLSCSFPMGQYPGTPMSSPAQMLTIVHRIRNYMSKPWFLKMTLEARDSPLAAVISRVLKPQVEDSLEKLVRVHTRLFMNSVPDRPSLRK